MADKSASSSRSSRRSFLKYGGTASIVALSGCTGNGGDGSGDTGTPTPTSGGTTGSGSNDFTVDGPVKIGVLGPLDAFYGGGQLGGAQIAAKRINDEGGLGGADVEVVTRNNHYDPQETLDKYQELVLEEEVDVTAGVVVSEYMMSLMDRLSQSETIHFGGGTGTPEATKLIARNYDKYKYFFRAGPLNGVNRGREAVRWLSNAMDDLGWSRLAVITEDFLWSEPYHSQCINRLPEQADVEVVMDTRVSSETDDYTPVLQDAESRNVDGVVVGLGHLGVKFTSQWFDYRPAFPIGGLNSQASDPAFFENIGGKCEYTVNSTYGGCMGTYPNEPHGKYLAEQWAKMKPYTSYPSISGYAVYDGLTMWAKAVRAAKSLDPEDVIPELEGTTLEGASGGPKVEFYPNDHKWPHDVKQGPDLMHEYQSQWRKGSVNDQPTYGGGSQNPLYSFPDDVQTGEFANPSWMS